MTWKVTGMTGNDEYIAWNAAIGDITFPKGDTPTPVYLDLEESVLLDLADRLGIEGGVDAAVAGLVDVNRWALGLNTSTVDFQRITALITRWSHSDRPEAGTPPPVLPTLALLSLAAERMTGSTSMSETNFYGRLNELLGLRQNDPRVQNAYRPVAERLWRTLNLWLDAQDGTRGIPTAFALGHRYVGLPMSQALLRRADQERLPAFFAEYAFAPGSSVPPEALTNAFDTWIKTRDVISSHVRRAWKYSKPAVAAGLAAYLASWDGSLSNDHVVSQRAGRGIRLALDLRTFPSRRLHLEPQVPVTESTPRAATLDTADGPVEIDLVAASPGWASFAIGSEVANEALLTGELRLSFDDDETLVHQPRRIMAFAQDETSARWTSTDRVQLGQDLLLLVHIELVDEVELALADCARPGWWWADSLKGLPAGWGLAQGVQLFKRPAFEGFQDLALLTPPAVFHSELAGGFRIPGTTRRTWHVDDPPELRLSAEKDLTASVIREASSMAATGADDQELWSQKSTDGMLVVSLSELELPVGAYRLDVKDAQGKVQTSNRFQLVSGDQREAVRWARADSVRYELGSALGALGVSSDSEPSAAVQGLYVDTPATPRLPAESVVVPTHARWEGPAAVAASSAKRRLSLVGVSDDSCLYKGNHVERVDTVPTDKWGKALIKYSYGRCQGCGLERRYSTHAPKYPKSATASTRDQATPRLLQPTHVGDGSIRSWDLVLDALFYLGRGNGRDFNRVAANVEPGPLFAFHALHLLESIGHLDVARDPRTLEVLAWEVSPTSAVRTGIEYRLVGHWPNEWTDTIVTQHDLPLFTLHVPDAPTNWYVAHPGDADIQVVEEPARQLLEQLPTLAEVVSALSRRAMPATESVEWCDPKSGRWTPAGPLSGRGAFRLNTYASRYFIRTTADAEGETVAAATAAVAKHSAPLILGQAPLLAYNAGTESLRVPLGSDLPGLYGRAVVATSGLPPQRRGGSLVYQDVPADIAQHLAWLMSTHQGVSL